MIENRPGGAGALGVQALLAAPVDGHTLLATVGSVFTVLPVQTNKVPFDVNRDLIPVALTSNEGMVFAVSPKLGVNNLAEFFARFSDLNVRSNPELDALVEQAQQLVRGVTPQALRDSDSLRQEVASSMAQVRQQVEGLITDVPRRRLVRSRPSGNGGSDATAD